MMNLQKRVEAFIELGNRLRNMSVWQCEDWQRRAQAHNGWFTPESVNAAIEGLIVYLEPVKLRSWIARYPLDRVTEKKIGVVMAGNIPMVGIHDFICVLISGHILHAKLSSQDPFLIKAVSSMLIEIEPAFAQKIHFVERLQGIDAIIATGSNNSARYFEYYFAKYPHIIRKNRNACAVLNGKESREQLSRLGRDIFEYFSMGCRSVSKLFVPEGYVFDTFFESIESNKVLMNNHKYINNYDYHKAVYLVNSIPHLDSGFLMVSENEGVASPISVTYYETYSDEAQLRQRIESLHDQLQCVVSAEGWFPGSVDMGQAQRPAIDDYADGVDTMRFLSEQLTGNS